MSAKDAKAEPTSHLYKNPFKQTQNDQKTPAGISSWPGTAYSDPVLSNLEERFHSIMTSLKETLVSRGIRGLLGLGRLFRILDMNNSQTLNYYEFTKALNDARLNFSEEDARVVFNFFDRHKDGHLQYSEFLAAVRGFMPDYRQALVEKAYENLVNEKSASQLTLEDVRLKFNPEFHPDVEAGRKTVEQVTNEFLEAFESHHVYFVSLGYQTKDQTLRNKFVSKKEFLEFFDSLSAVTPNDLNFEKAAVKVWNKPVKKQNLRKY